MSGDVLARRLLCWEQDDALAGRLQRALSLGAGEDADVSQLETAQLLATAGELCKKTTRRAHVELRFVLEALLCQRVTTDTTVVLDLLQKLLGSVHDCVSVESDASAAFAAQALLLRSLRLRELRDAWLECDTPSSTSSHVLLANNGALFGALRRQVASRLPQSRTWLPLLLALVCAASVTTDILDQCEDAKELVSEFAPVLMTCAQEEELHLPSALSQMYDWARSRGAPGSVCRRHAMSAQLGIWTVLFASPLCSTVQGALFPPDYRAQAPVLGADGACRDDFADILRVCARVLGEAGHADEDGDVVGTFWRRPRVAELLLPLFRQSLERFPQSMDFLYLLAELIKKGGQESAWATQWLLRGTLTVAERGVSRRLLADASTAPRQPPASRFVDALGLGVDGTRPVQVSVALRGSGEDRRVGGLPFGVDMRVPYGTHGVVVSQSASDDDNFVLWTLEAPYSALATALHVSVRQFESLSHVDTATRCKSLSDIAAVVHLLTSLCFVRARGDAMSDDSSVAEAASECLDDEEWLDAEHVTLSPLHADVENFLARDVQRRHMQHQQQNISASNAGVNSFAMSLASESDTASGSESAVVWSVEWLVRCLQALLGAARVTPAMRHARHADDWRRLALHAALWLRCPTLHRSCPSLARLVQTTWHWASSAVSSGGESDMSDGVVLLAALSHRGVKAPLRDVVPLMQSVRAVQRRVLRAVQTPLRLVSHTVSEDAAPGSGISKALSATKTTSAAAGSRAQQLIVRLTTGEAAASTQQPTSSAQALATLSAARAVRSILPTLLQEGALRDVAVFGDAERPLALVEIHSQRDAARLLRDIVLSLKDVESPEDAVVTGVEWSRALLRLTLFLAAHAKLVWPHSAPTIVSARSADEAAAAALGALARLCRARRLDTELARAGLDLPASVQTQSALLLVSSGTTQEKETSAASTLARQQDALGPLGQALLQLMPPDAEGGDAHLAALELAAALFEHDVLLRRRLLTRSDVADVAALWTQRYAPQPEQVPASLAPFVRLVTQAWHSCASNTDDTDDTQQRYASDTMRLGDFVLKVALHSRDAAALCLALKLLISLLFTGTGTVLAGGGKYFVALAKRVRVRVPLLLELVLDSIVSGERSSEKVRLARSLCQLVQVLLQYPTQAGLSTGSIVALLLQAAECVPHADVSQSRDVLSQGTLAHGSPSESEPLHWLLLLLLRLVRRLPTPSTDLSIASPETDPALSLQHCVSMGHAFLALFRRLPCASTALLLVTMCTCADAFTRRATSSLTVLPTHAPAESQSTLNNAALLQSRSADALVDAVRDVREVSQETRQVLLTLLPPLLLNTQVSSHLGMQRTPAHAAELVPMLLQALSAAVHSVSCFPCELADMRSALRLKKECAVADQARSLLGTLRALQLAHEQQSHDSLVDSLLLGADADRSCAVLLLADTARHALKAACGADAVAVAVSQLQTMPSATAPATGPGAGQSPPSDAGKTDAEKEDLVQLAIAAASAWTRVFDACVALLVHALRHTRDCRATSRVYVFSLAIRDVARRATCVSSSSTDEHASLRVLPFAALQQVRAWAQLQRALLERAAREQEDAARRQDNEATVRHALTLLERMSDVLVRTVTGKRVPIRVFDERQSRRAESLVAVALRELLHVVLAAHRASPRLALPLFSLVLRCSRSVRDHAMVVGEVAPARWTPPPLVSLGDLLLRYLAPRLATLSSSSSSSTGGNKQSTLASDQRSTVPTLPAGAAQPVLTISAIADDDDLDLDETDDADLSFSPVALHSGALQSSKRSRQLRLLNECAEIVAFLLTALLTNNAELRAEQLLQVPSDESDESDDELHPHQRLARRLLSHKMEHLSPAAAHETALFADALSRCMHQIIESCEGQDLDLLQSSLQHIDALRQVLQPSTSSHFVNVDTTATIASSHFANGGSGSAFALANIPPLASVPVSPALLPAKLVSQAMTS